MHQFQERRELDSTLRYVTSECRTCVSLAAHQGLTGVEEDLQLLWIELLRVSSSLAASRVPRRSATLRSLPGLQTGEGAG